MDTKKIDRAIKLLRSIPANQIELDYSSGKDSDVILRLAQLAKIPITIIHKCTTIDRPYTISHALRNGATIMRPEIPLIQAIKRNGWPTRRVRWCCSRYKEYPIHEYAIYGIRADESKERRNRYQEPITCRVYSHKRRVNMVTPILDWTLQDEADFIEMEQIKLHPYYYLPNGKIDYHRRLGCIGCPLRGDRGRKDFLEFPGMFRLWANAGTYWYKTHQHTSSAKNFPTSYDLIYHNMFCRSYEDYQAKAYNIFGHYDFKPFLENYFGVEID